jgi:hypothetical protein
MFSLTIGGIETMLVDIVNRQCEKHEVDLIILNDYYDQKLLDSISPRVRVHLINRKRKTRSYWKVIQMNLLIWKIRPNIINTHNENIGKYHLNPVTVPERKSSFCDAQRAQEILKEIEESDARLLVLLGDIPIKQFLKRVADIPYTSLQEYVDLFGYGNPTDVTIQGKIIKVLPLAHPRQIGALGTHSEKWYQMHQKWEKKR